MKGCLQYQSYVANHLSYKLSSDLSLISMALLTLIEVQKTDNVKVRVRKIMRPMLWAKATFSLDGRRHVQGLHHWYS
jgi:hypothetical protein